MSTYDWPTARAFQPREMALVVRHNQAQSVSALSGYTQTLSRPGARWGWRMQFSSNTLEERRQVEGYVLRLAGREHLVRLWDMRYPRPAGNCNLAGVTVASAAAAFARSMAIQGCGAGRQLLAGDWFSVNGQLLRMAADATANGSGQMTIYFEHMLRAAVSPGAALVLDKPTSNYSLAASELEFPRIPGLSSAPFSLEFTERWEV